MKCRIMTIGAAVILLAGALSIQAQAKISEPAQTTPYADYYIIKECTIDDIGEVSAKIQNKTEEVIIPEEISIDTKKYRVTEISGLNYCDTVDRTLKHDSCKNKKNKTTKKIVLPGTIKKIQKGAFTNYTKLDEIIISSDNSNFICRDGAVLSHDGKILYGTVSLNKKYTVPAGVTTIADRAFAYSKVRTIVLPESCKKIGQRSFYKCKNLKKIKGLDNVMKLGKGAIWGTKIKQ